MDGRITSGSSETRVRMSNQTENLETASSEAGTWFSSRYCLCYLALLGFVNIYTLRFNLSVAILSMVNNAINGTDNPGSCPHNITNNTHINGDFDWDQRRQELILGAFFYGYILTQIPGGYLAGRFGGKFIFGGGILCTSVLTLLTPIAAKANKDGWVLFSLRVLEGLAEGVTFPAMHAIWGKWAPPVERTFLVSLSNAGAQLGTVISLPISGALCDSFLGWESVFYLFGALGIVWSVIWFIFAHNSPEVHPRISAAERTYITSNITQVDESLPTPWLEIATSKPVWAISIAHFCNNWGYYMLLISIPQYFSEILHFNPTKDGISSALPSLCMWIMINVVGFVADTLRRRRLLTTTRTRKLFNSIGFVGPAVFLIVTGLVGCDPTAAVAIVCIAYSINAFMYAGYYSNHIDISSRYAGVLMGISNTWATIPGFVAPAVVGELTEHHNTHRQWMVAFYITAGIYVIGSLAYLVLGSGVEQEWNKPGSQRRALRGNDVRSQRAPLINQEAFVTCNAGPDLAGAVPQTT